MITIIIDSRAKIKKRSVYLFLFKALSRQRTRERESERESESRYGVYFFYIRRGKTYGVGEGVCNVLSAFTQV